MVPSFCISLNELEQGQLLEIARQSIESGLAVGSALQLDIDNLSGSFSTLSGTFVTLTQSSQLRGCIGSLESLDPLAQSVANAAFNAAFRDARFTPLKVDEIKDIQVEISVLSELEPFAVANRSELLDRLSVGEDGLLLEDGSHRSTFLPKVWDMVADPEEFLNHLLAKAGLPDDYWSETIRFKRYQALSFGE
jgi:AmmeMemoRadiSam system protein A